MEQITKINWDYVNEKIKIQQQRIILPEHLFSKQTARQLIQHVLNKYLRGDVVWNKDYDKVINWCDNTRNKGLLLCGGCGTGKTVFLTVVIPSILKLCDKCITPVNAMEITREKYPALVKKNILAIDDLGTELPISIDSYTVTFNPVQKLIEQVGNRNGVLFATTNLSTEQMVELYGERAMDRLNKMCSMVEFSGESLR